MSTNGLTNGVEKDSPSVAMTPVSARKAVAKKATVGKTLVAKPGATKTSTKAVASKLDGAAGASEYARLEITQHDIARLAHLLWESRGYSGGSPEHDWRLAEGYLAELAGRVS